MSVRVLLAVVFTVVLVAAVAPAIDGARDARSRAAATRAADALADGARELVEGGEPPPAGIAGSARTVTVNLPPGCSLVVGDERRVLRTTVDGHRADATALPVPAHLPELEPGSELRIGGRVTLHLRYERRASEPVIVITRGFIRESGAKKGYVLTPGVAPPHPRPRVH